MLLGDGIRIIILAIYAGAVAGIILAIVLNERQN
jgi:hypothetical protein